MAEHLKNLWQENSTWSRRNPLTVGVRIAAMNMNPLVAPVRKLECLWVTGMFQARSRGAPQCPSALLFYVHQKGLALHMFNERHWDKSKNTPPPTYLKKWPEDQLRSLPMIYYFSKFGAPRKLWATSFSEYMNIRVEITLLLGAISKTLI